MACLPPRSRRHDLAGGTNRAKPREIRPLADYDNANPIRVRSIAYGTDAVQSHEVDPRTHAVENAWRAGITVVVAGGNDGPTARLVNPAHDPYVLNGRNATSAKLPIAAGRLSGLTRRAALTGEPTEP
jgi:hypothetical protein